MVSSYLNDVCFSISMRIGWTATQSTQNADLSHPGVRPRFHDEKIMAWEFTGVPLLEKVSKIPG